VNQMFPSGPLVMKAGTSLTGNGVIVTAAIAEPGTPSARQYVIAQAPTAARDAARMSMGVPPRTPTATPVPAIRTRRPVRPRAQYSTSGRHARRRIAQFPNLPSTRCRRLDPARASASFAAIPACCLLHLNRPHAPPDRSRRPLVRMTIPDARRASPEVPRPHRAGYARP
jgi:hypothetical protein